MCYEMLSRNEKCLDCSFEEVVATKKMLSRERYIPELNKFMDVCYNPVLDKMENYYLLLRGLET